MIDIVEELKVLVSQLDERQIDYALCGGLALAVYDRARATADIDLLILAESLPDVIEIAKYESQRSIREPESFCRLICFWLPRRFRKYGIRAFRPIGKVESYQ